MAGEKLDQREIATRTKILDTIVATSALRPQRHQFAELAHLSPRTLDTHLVALRDMKLVAPRAPYRLGPAFGKVLAIALRTHSISAALVDPHGEVVGEGRGMRESGLRSQAPRELLGTLRLVVTRLLGDAGIRSVDLVGIAVAVPTPLRKTTRPVGQSMHDDWRNADLTQTLREEIATALGAPVVRVHVINDGHVHALATAHDQSREESAEAAARELEMPNHDRSIYRDRVSITLHLGGVVGAGLVLLGREQPGAKLGFIDTRLLAGGHSIGGEIAHLPMSQHWFPVIDQRSAYADLARTDPKRKCFCGASRHLQAHATDDAVAARVPHLGLRELNRVLREDEVLDPDVGAALRDVGFLLGLVMMSPLKLLDPKTVHFTGLLAREETVTGFRAGLEERTWTGPEVDLRMPKPGVENLHLGLRGAALIVYREWIYRKFRRIVETNRTHGTQYDSLPITFTYRCPS